MCSFFTTRLRPFPLGVPWSGHFFSFVFWRRAFMYVRVYYSVRDKVMNSFAIFSYGYKKKKKHYSHKLPRIYMLYYVRCKAFTRFRNLHFKSTRTSCGDDVRAVGEGRHRMRGDRPLGRQCARVEEETNIVYNTLIN